MNTYCAAAIRTILDVHHTSIIFVCVCVDYNDEDELSSSSESSPTNGYSSVNTELLSIPSTTTPRPSCLCC